MAREFRIFRARVAQPDEVADAAPAPRDLTAAVQGKPSRSVIDTVRALLSRRSPIGPAPHVAQARTAPPAPDLQAAIQKRSR